MREDTLITEVRMAAQLPATFADYTDARIRIELNTILQSRFAPMIADARVGSMLKRHSQTLTSGTATYPLPGRALAAGFEAIDANDGSTYWPMKEIQPSEVWKYETSTTGKPEFYAVVGSSYRLYPTPNDAYTVRCQYYLRPSNLVQFQTTGRVTSVDQSLRRITVDTSIASITDRVRAAAISNSYPIDVVRLDSAGPATVEPSNASYELTLVSATWTTVDTAIIGVDAGFDMTEVRAGDYVRAYNQSDWPSIPHEYHPALAALAAAKICRNRGMYNAAKELEASANEDIAVMRRAIAPRVKSEAQSLRPHAHMLRRGFS